MDWDDYLSKGTALRIIRKAVFKSIPAHQDLANEAVSFIAEEILKDNKRRLQSYRPGTDPANFLYFVARRIMRDFWVLKKGRFRCPSALQREKEAGFLKVLIYRMLCWQQLPADFIVERLKDAGKREEDVKDLIWKIRQAYRDCGKPREIEIAFEETSDFSSQEAEAVSLNSQQSEEISNLDHVWANDLSYFFNYILRSVPEKIPENRIISAKTRQQMAKARRKFKASDDECKFFRLIHLAEMSVSSAGRLLGWRKDVAHGKSRRLWKKFCRVVPKEILKEFDPCLELRRVTSRPIEAHDESP